MNKFMKSKGESELNLFMFLRRMPYLVSMEAGMVCQACNKLQEYDGTNSSFALRWERNVESVLERTLVYKERSPTPT